MTDSVIRGAGVEDFFALASKAMTSPPSSTGSFTRGSSGVVSFFVLSPVLACNYLPSRALFPLMKNCLILAVADIVGSSSSLYPAK
jgi:hypothetical protein